MAPAPQQMTPAPQPIAPAPQPMAPAPPPMASAHQPMPPGVAPMAQVPAPMPTPPGPPPMVFGPMPNAPPGPPPMKENPGPSPMKGEPPGCRPKTAQIPTPTAPQADKADVKASCGKSVFEKVDDELEKKEMEVKQLAKLTAAKEEVAEEAMETKEEAFSEPTDIGEIDDEDFPRPWDALEVPGAQESKVADREDYANVLQKMRERWAKDRADGYHGEDHGEDPADAAAVPEMALPSSSSGTKVVQAKRRPDHDQWVRSKRPKPVPVPVSVHHTRTGFVKKINKPKEPPPHQPCPDSNKCLYMFGATGYSSQ